MELLKLNIAVNKLKRNQIRVKRMQFIKIGNN